MTKYITLSIVTGLRQELPVGDPAGDGIGTETSTILCIST